MMKEEIQWWPIAVICGCLMAGGVITTALLHPAPSRPGPALVWQAEVGGAYGHRIRVWGRGDPALIQAAIQRDRELGPAPLPPAGAETARLEQLERELDRLDASLVALNSRVQVLVDLQTKAGPRTEAPPGEGPPSGESGAVRITIDRSGNPSGP